MKGYNDIVVATEQQYRIRESGRNSMGLYCWQPNGHGQKSFFVIAHTLEEAEEAVRKLIKILKYSSDYEGWPEYYDLRIAPRGTVVFNDND